jgi:uncharacterized phage protein (TIGR01671 family)
MRELKFRAWNKKEKQMYFNSRLDLFFRHMIYIGKEFEIMQYTGLHDNKRTTEYPEGQEIYEGDIIRYTNEIEEIFHEEIGIVVFEQAECNFCIQRTVVNLENYPVPKTTHTIYLIDNVQYHAAYEVIGNIYENPELLNT